MPIGEDVFSAADQLDATGKQVSVRAVRETIGRGSFRDVCPHLARWRADRDARARKAAAGETDAVARALTPETERIMLGFLENAWREALTQAQRQFEEERRSLTERADALQLMLDEALVRAETADDAYEMLAGAVAQHIDLLPKKPSPETGEALQKIWKQVRQIADEIANQNGGTFSTKDVAAALPPEINEKLKALGNLPMTSEKIAHGFFRRHWFERVKGYSFKLYGPSTLTPIKKDG